MHLKCSNNVTKSTHLSWKQKNSCVLCRTAYPATDEEHVEQVNNHVQRGAAWAQYQMGTIYSNGEQGVVQSYKRARELYLLGE